MLDGELATYPKLAIIRNHCLIELCLNQNIITLREKLVHNLPHNTDVASRQTTKPRISSLEKEGDGGEKKMRGSVSNILSPEREQ
jgi:hypothetical protein